MYNILTNHGAFMDIDKLNSLSKEDLINRLMEMNNENKALEKMATTDKLTNLHNRASYDDHIAVQIDLAERSGHPLSIIVIDLDKFKDVNDNYGHSFGDMVLKITAKTLNIKSRKSDIACRYGGEELILILPETSRAGAAVAAEKIRIAFEKINYKKPDGGSFKVTGSFGVASFSKGDTAQALFEKADKAVYNAKENGRNMVKVTDNRSVKIKEGIFDTSDIDILLVGKEESIKEKRKSKIQP